MNRNKAIKVSAVISIFSILFIYSLVLLIISVRTNSSIKEMNSKMFILKKKIKKEKKNQEIIKNIDKNYIENAYFSRDGNFFENYIRTLFRKYYVKLDIYQSMMNEKDYSEIGINFVINAYQFFRLLEDIENGKHLVVIKQLAISRENYPDFKVTMKLGGYYKE